MDKFPQPKIKEKRTLVETINPKNLPEAAFQSYEKLSNNALARREAFLASKSRNPDLLYSGFRNLSDMDKGILRLSAVLDELESLVDDESIRSVVASSLRYRMAEMEYIKLLGQLDDVFHETDDVAEVSELAKRAKEASETLYGQVDPEVRDGALNLVWNNLDSKSWQGKAQQLYNDLTNGFVSEEGFIVGPMKRAEDQTAELPQFDDSTAWAGAHFEEKNADIEAALQEFWDAKVQEHGEGYTCLPTDIVEAFKIAFSLRDPDNNAGVDVRLSEGKTTLSWESAELSVLVGSKRAAVTSPRVLFTRFTHEGGHGEKAINGLKTDIPVFGLGMYTDTPRPDYLTFEEGYLTIIESAMDGDHHHGMERV